MNIKRKILTVAITLALAAPAMPAVAQVQSDSEQPQIEIINENVVIEEVQNAPAEQPAIHESKIAKKMTQAEKAKNAAENDGWGGAITIIAMCIVVGALIVLSVLFLIFGKVSETLITSRKKKAKQAADHAHDESHYELASGEVIAAISLALSEHFGEGHDVEDTILTIRRLQKSYSPWNSKIYNLRLAPDHRRNPATAINFNESKRIQI